MQLRIIQGWQNILKHDINLLIALSGHMMLCSLNVEMKFYPLVGWYPLYSYVYNGLKLCFAKINVSEMFHTCKLKFV